MIRGDYTTSAHRARAFWVEWAVNKYFRFFIVRSLQLSSHGGRFGNIIPLALLADISCASCRRHLMRSATDILCCCFPQKDDSARRVFSDAKLSTAVITCKRENTASKSAAMTVRVYPWNRFEDRHKEATIHLCDTELIDSRNTPIPLVDSTNWRLCRQIHSLPNVVRLGEIADFAIRRGEVNQTVFRRLISEDPQGARLLKGVEVGQYRLNNKLSQGKREWFDESTYLKDFPPRPTTKMQRIVTQRITGVDERLRIVATIIDPPMYFADSTNSIALTNPESKYNLKYLLGLLNSSLYQWRFKLTSTNNNVGTN